MSSNQILIKLAADVSNLVQGLDKVEKRQNAMEAQTAKMAASAARSGKALKGMWEVAKADVDKYTSSARKAETVGEMRASLRSLKVATIRWKELDEQIKSTTASATKIATAGPGPAVGSLNAMLVRRDALMDKVSNAGVTSPSRKADIADLQLLNKLIRETKREMESVGAKEQKWIPPVALGSAEAMRQKVRYLKRELDKIADGPGADKLREKLAEARKELQALGSKSREVMQQMSQAAKAPEGSFMRVGYELRKAKIELSQLTEGTAAYTAKQAQVQAMATQYERIRKGMKGIKEETVEQNGAMTGLIGQAKSLLLTYAGIHQAVALATEEWRKQRDLQKDIANKGLTFEQEMVRQLPNIEVQNLQEAKRFAIEAKASPDPKDTLRLIGEAMSTGVSFENAKKVSVAALRLSGGMAELADGMSMAAIQTARINNTTDFEAAMGQVRSMAAVSQAIKEPEFLENATGAMASLTRDRRNIKGMSSEQAWEKLTIAGRIKVDMEGATSATAFQSMLDYTDEFNPQAKKKLKDGTISRLSQETIDTFRAEKEFDKRMEMLSGNQDLRNQWLDKMKKGGPRNLAVAWSGGGQDIAALTKEVEDAILSLGDGALYFKSVVGAIPALVPNLMAHNRLMGGSAAALLGDDEQVSAATGRMIWDSIWNGGKVGQTELSAVNLTGPDALIRANAWQERSMGSVGRRMSLMGEKFESPGIESLKDMQRWIESRIETERGFGNTVAAETLAQGQLESLKIVIEELRRLNDKVEQNGAADGRPAQAPPRAVVPAAPVVRVPIAQGGGGGGGTPSRRALLMGN